MPGILIASGIAFFLMDPTQVALPEERLCAESEDWLYTCFGKRYVDMSGEKKKVLRNFKSKIGHFYLLALTCAQQQPF